MIVRDLVLLDYNLPFVIDGVEYEDNHNIPQDILLSVVDGFELKDSKEHRGLYKLYLQITPRKK